MTVDKHGNAAAQQPDQDKAKADAMKPASMLGRDESLDLLRASESRYRRLFEAAQDGILLLDAQTGQITDVNPFMIQMLGYPYDHFIGQELWEIGAVRDIDSSREAFLQLQEQRYVRYEDLPLQASDGRRMQVEFVSNVYQVGNTEVIQCNIRDISARKAAEAALSEASRRIADLHQAAHRLETSESEEEVCRLSIEAAEMILGFQTCSLYLAAGDRLSVQAVSSDAVARPGQEIPLIGPAGGLAAETLRTGKAVVFTSLAEAPACCLQDPDLQSGISVPVGTLGIFQARSELPGAFTEADGHLLELLGGYTAEALRRIRLQVQLRDQATRDPLTGVHNRRYFTEVISQETSRAKRHGRPIGFLMIDVNRFKQINDQLGHMVGDRVLMAVGALLRQAVRGEDFVIRYGGDEFLIVLPETNGETNTIEARILAAVAAWNEQNQTWLGFPLSLSIGDAHWMADSERSIEEVLAEADRRMYERKRGER
jgi:diguanylate cyclase (GGDEF)-like protein/PAS domain S-box-containing protein